ncbi:hypothetical protein ACRWQL_01380 [Shewanella sp. HL-SH4]|jgi:hypothetical protein|uniref:hypothetical protein n=1 Tax=Shewanella TaxID=22 RepID=UPI001CF8A193|nr:hypothetical protein [Shewanella glacialimarina]UCX04789.1 hypothetical protein FJ709_09900 [Shewanella glacialimarina]
MSRLGVLQVILTILSLLGWSLAIYALLIYGEARPDRAVGYFLSQGVEVRFDWDAALTVKLEYIIWWCAGVSLLNLLVNFYAKTTTRMGVWFNIPLLLLVSLSAGLYIRFVI